MFSLTYPSEGITLPEMTKYLSSIFLVMRESNPRVFEQYGVTPDELAYVTTMGAFGESGLRETEVMDWQKFKAWFERAENVPRQALSEGEEGFGRPASAASGQRIELSSPPTGTLPTIEEIRRITGLEKFSPSDLLETFAALTNDEGYIPLHAFLVCMRKISIDAGGLETMLDIVNEIGVLLFSAFDVNGDGVVDFLELSSGICVLGGGSQAERSLLVFRLYDINGDGFISYDEFVSYLKSVFAVAYRLNPSLETEVGAGYMALAEATAMEAFEKADLNGDGKLSYQEFFKWYSMANPNSDEQKRPRANSARNLEEFRAWSSVSKLDCGALVKHFANGATSDGYVSSSQFSNQLEALLDSLDVDSTEEERARDTFERFWASLSDSLDSNQAIHISKLAAGFSVICGGEADDKVEMAFSLFDKKGTGYIDFEEMTEYLSSVYSLMFEADENNDHPDPLEFAKAMAFEAFEKADINKDGRISLPEFKLWYSGADATASEIQHATESPFVTLAQAKQISNMGSYPVHVVFQLFSEFAEDDGFVTFAGFQKCFQILVDASDFDDDSVSEYEKKRTDIVMKRLFQLFGPGDKVRYDELVSGLSVLCGGTHREKTSASFALYDLYGDKTIDEASLSTYLCSVFRVLFETSPEIKSRWLNEMGVTADDLGRLTAEQAFEEASLNNDGRLHFEEFRTWYENCQIVDENDDIGEIGGSEDETNQLLREQRDAHKSRINMELVQKITGLEDQHVDDVFELFASMATSGLLTIGAFRRCFDIIIQERAELLTSEEMSYAPLIVDGLFAALDINGDNYLDYSELASGISVLCGGTKDEKVEAAFALFDLNGDGHITLEEMITYLSAMFSIIFFVSPETKDNVDVDARELAEATAQQAFADADLNDDGKLSLEEFNHWYMAVNSDSFVTASSAGDDSGPAEGDKRQPSWLTLKNLRRLTTFMKYSTSTVFDHFANASNSNGMLTSQSFVSCCGDFLRDKVELGVTDAEYAEICEVIVGGLFQIFETQSGSDLVDFAELAAGLSFLCGGTKDERALAGFKLFDVDETDYISQNELVVYLTSVFKILFWCEPDGTRASVGDLTPEALAKLTAMEAFEASEEVGDKLSFENFKEWINISGELDESEEGSAVGGFPGSGGWNAQEIQEKMRNLSNLTSLQFFGATEMLERLAESADEEDGLISIKNLYTLLLKFNIERSSATSFDSDALITFVVSLKDQFDGVYEDDENAEEIDARLDFSVIACALLCLCKSSWEEKVQVGFSLFEEEGLVSIDDLIIFIESVFKIVSLASPETVYESENASFNDLATATAKRACSGRGRGEVIDFEGFVEICRPFLGGDESGEEEGEGEGEGEVLKKGNTEKELAPVAENGMSNKHREFPKDEMQRAREILGLGSVSVDDLLEILSEAAPNGVLDEGTFNNCLRNLATLSGRSGYGIEYTETASLGSKIFRAFKRDRNDAVDFAELTSGLSVLCNSNAKEKFITTFTIHDADGDGLLEPDEVEHFMANVYKVLFACVDGLQEIVGPDPEDLAKITTAKCFQDLEISNNKIGIGALLTYFVPQ